MRAPSDSTKSVETTALSDSSALNQRPCANCGTYNVVFAGSPHKRARAASFAPFASFATLAVFRVTHASCSDHTSDVCTPGTVNSAARILSPTYSPNHTHASARYVRNKSSIAVFTVALTACAASDVATATPITNIVTNARPCRRARFRTDMAANGGSATIFCSNRSTRPAPYVGVMPYDSSASLTGMRVALNAGSAPANNVTPMPTKMPSATPSGETWKSTGKFNSVPMYSINCQLANAPTSKPNAVPPPPYTSAESK